MAEKKFLNEEKYQKTEKSITTVAFLILLVGLYIGGFLIFKGAVKPSASKIESLKDELEIKKSELESKGVKYNASAKYYDGDEYDLKVIVNVMDPSFSYCSFDEYKNNSLTKEYCATKNSFGRTGMIIAGIFISILTLMIFSFIFSIAKRRRILAFSAQQVIPIAKEEIDEMAPTIGNAAGEIAKGIKRGLSDDKK